MRESHYLTQGSDAWKAFREKHFGASEASAMLGMSPYKTRDQLLHEKATGLTKEVDPGTQKVFDRGHEVEKLARPIVEKMIGVELSPVVMSLGKLSASTDGLDFEGVIAWENKQFNQAHYEQVKNGELPEIHWPQCQQVLHVTGAEKLFFTISDGTEENTAGVWVYVDESKVALLHAGWNQFSDDLESYSPPVKIEKVEASQVKVLPTPSVVVKGEVHVSNLNEITPKFDEYLSSINTNLVSDSDFADAEANAKNCREMGKRIEALQDNIIAQMVSVNEVNGILENYKKAFNQVGLRLEKAVKEQKESLKTQAIMQAKQAYNDHLNELQKNCVVMLNLVVPQPDFAGAIKGVKTIVSMHSRINDALAAGKSALSVEYQNIALKSEYIKSNIEGYAHLINIADLATKDMDYIKLHIQSVKDAEDKRKAEHEAAIKAKAEAEARAKVEAEQRAKAESELKVAYQRAGQPINEVKPVEAKAETLPAQAEAVSLAQHQSTIFSDLTSVQPMSRPSRDEIVSLVADHYGVTHHQAHGWLNDLFYAMAA